MKRIVGLVRTLIVGSLGLMFVNGCNKQSATGTVESGSLKPAEQTSFKDVTSKLDPGGNLYVYLSTEQWLTNLSDNLGKWRGMASSLPNVKGHEEDVQKAFDVVTRVIKDSGIEDVSGIGMSSIAREPGTYYNKVVVHHYSGQGNGFIWTIFGKHAHELDGLDLLPTDTAVAFFNDADVQEMWSVIQKECEQSGYPQAKQALDQFRQQFETGTALKWDDVVDSLGGEFGVVMTLDPAKTVTLPMPTQVPLEIPSPGLMLAAKVKNDTIFNRLDEQLKKQMGSRVISTDKGGLKMRTVPVPIPIGIPLRPSIATSGGYLFIATSDGLIQEALAVKGGKPGLKSTDEFKKLMTGVPMQGNQFAFVSRRFGETMIQIQQAAVESNQQTPAQLKELVQSLLQPENAGFGFTVGANTDEGWLAVGNGNQSGGKMLAAASVVPAAVLAGATLPALAKAKARAQRIQCINNLRAIEAAKETWAMENNKKTGVPGWSDIEPYLGKGHNGMLHCPTGGEYTIGPIGENPRCSIPEHVLPPN